MYTRRAFLTTGSRIAAASLIGSAFRPPCFAQTSGATEQTEASFADSAAISFSTTDSAYQSLYNHALDLLAANVQKMYGFDKPVLIEGSVYRGVWLECGPQEGLVYSLIRPDVARNNHLLFFELQKEDGQIPCSVKPTEAGFGQIQMVVPIAATAWELAQQTQDTELIEKAYRSCSQWDAWLRRYRDTRHTGLCEGFCTYDTGHDNSPRWAGIPNRCPDADARKCPPIPSLPRLCPDLSATVYGGRVALAAMARALGKTDEADRWLEDAATIRTAIVDRLYDSEDAAFYDLDAQDHFVRIRGDVITRVLGERVPDQKLFETIYRRQIHNPKAFWAPYPLPSIALDDSTFVRPIPRNSWGGAAQALTALRAPRWMEHYGKPADLAYLMQQWVAALLRAQDFRQQMDPLTGEFTMADPAGYSPAALVFLDFTWRLAGVRAVDGELEWNVRTSLAGGYTSFRLRVSPTLTAEIKYGSNTATLLLNGRVLCRTSSTVRLRTTLDGALRSAAGIASQRTSVTLQMASGKPHTFSIEPNSTVHLS
ncbi:MAG TPA: hypothetical protein VL991_13465 [Terracidiphilus sp.]|nr:hypothetical protein [Terracidiphilus sp.]